MTAPGVYNPPTLTDERKEKQRGRYIICATEKEQNRIKKLYKNLPKDKLEIAKKLMERAAYMLVSLEDMEEKINEDGLVVKMPQGSYTIERAHPLLQPYNAMVKNYNATLKQLNDLLPNADAEAAGQALMMFATKPSRAAKSG